MSGLRIDFAPNSFDVVISSLALHYVEHFDSVCQRLHHCLSAGGTFVLSVEHPVFTALPAQDWFHGQAGERLHWPLDRYQDEGPRHTRFLDNDVLKYHRTIATYFNALIGAGFLIAGVSEPQPTQEMLARYPELLDEIRRPLFLLIAATRS